MKNLFPLSHIKNIKLFYILTILTNCWFISANWIFFWTRLMTYKQLGIVDASAFAFGLLMEIPTGAIADMLGKKKTLLTSLFISACSVLFITFSNSLFSFWTGFFVLQLGWALYSGTAEAFAYDTLVDHKKEKSFDQVISTSGTLTGITSISALALGGIAYAINFRLSHFLWGLAYLIGFFLAFGLTEPKMDTEKFSLKAYFAKILEGVKYLFQRSLRPFLVIILVLMGSDYMFHWGLIKPAMGMMFHFNANTMSILFTIFGIISVGVIKFLPQIRRLINDTLGLYLLAIVMAVGFGLAFFDLGYWGAIAILLIWLAGTLTQPWISVVVNQKIPSTSRATTLSTVALITKIPYVFTAIVAGQMLQEGKLNVFSLGVAIFILMSILASSLMMFIQKNLIKNSKTMLVE